MNKQAVRAAIIEHLTRQVQVASSAADEARETATNKENIAENKYDTLGLEAAYLAHGQSNRVRELQEEVQRFSVLSDTDSDAAGLGSLVLIERRPGEDWLYVGPGAAGLKVEVGSEKVTVVTPESPLGKLLMNQGEGDIVSFNGEDIEVLAVF